MDVTIQFHRSQWDNLSEAARALISQYCGPLYPDEKGVLTLTVDEARWLEIQQATRLAGTRD